MNRRVAVAERQRRTREAVAHDGAAGPSSPPSSSPATRGLVVLPDTDAHAVAAAAAERVERAHQAALAATASRQRSEQLLEEHQARLASLRRSTTVAASTTTAVAAVTAARPSPAQAAAPAIVATAPAPAIAPPVTEPVVQPVAEPVVQPVAEPVVPPVAEPVAPAPPVARRVIPPAAPERTAAVPLTKAPPAAAAPPVAPPGTSSPAARERRRRRVLLPLFAVLVVAAVVALGVVRLDRGGEQAGGGGPTAAGGLPAQGTLAVNAAIGADQIEVDEVTTLGQDRPDQVLLQLPDLAGAGEVAAAAQIEVQDLQVRLDGEPATVEQDPGFPGRWTVEVPEGATPRQLDVTYALTGALVTSDQSAPGRQLAVVGPLSAGASTGEASVAVTGDGVLNVFCPGLPADELLCATQTGTTWDAALPRPSASALLVQIDRG